MTVGKVHTVSKDTYTWALLTSPKSVLTPLLTLNSPVLALPFFGISCHMYSYTWAGVAGGTRPSPHSSWASAGVERRPWAGKLFRLCLRMKLPVPILSPPVWPWTPRQPVPFLNPISKRGSGHAVSEEGPHGSNFPGW